MAAAGPFARDARGTPEPEFSPVDGMNIFWILLVLTAAVAFHPVGTAPGFTPQFVRYIRMTPLCSALDALKLYSDLFREWNWQNGHPLRTIAQAIGIQRLRLNSSGENANDDREDIQVLEMEFGIGRVIANAGVLFAFTKICGFHGVPFSQSLAALLFPVWVSLEAFLIVAFFRVRPEEQQDPGLQRLVAAMRQRRQREEKTSTWSLLSSLLLYSQLLALAIALPVLMIFSRQDSTSPLPDTAGAGFRFSTVLRTWLGILKFGLMWPALLLEWLVPDLELPAFGIQWLWRIPYLLFSYPLMIVVGYLGAAFSFFALALSISGIWWLGVGLGVCVIYAAVWVQSLHFSVVRWIGEHKAGCQLFFLRALALYFVVVILVYFNIFWDDTGTWKQSWTGKLD